ncbi:MAG: DUF1592 domain-containing protein [Armatimonadota bacterium]|nr:DUF1592 domain-containing protein [Armatimonadota bacterium]
MIVRSAFFFLASLLSCGMMLYAAAPAPVRYVPLAAKAQQSDKPHAKPQAKPEKPAASAPKSITTKAAAPKAAVSKAVATKVTAPAGAPTFERDVLPLINQYCIKCHRAENKSPAAGLPLAGYKSVAEVLKKRGDWELVARNVGSGHMPPEDFPAPSRAQRNRLVEWIETKLSQADCNIKDPGRVTLHRLNREEYNNTIRDLLGIEFRPADDFPSDDVGYGFDNIGDVLSISPLLMEKYLAAAEKIAEQAIVLPDKNVRFEAERLDPDAASGDRGGVLLGVTGSETGSDYEFPKAGAYLLRARAFGEQAGPDPVRMAFRLDGKDLRVVDVTAVEKASAVYDESVTVPAGKHRFAVVYTNNYKNLQTTDPKLRGDRNLIVEYLEIVGPLNTPEGLPASHRRIITCPTTGHQHGPECARAILKELSGRAYRRPASEQEIDRLVRYVGLARKEGESFERGIQLALQAVLVSPRFLFRVEVDPNPNDPKKSRSLSDYEIAARLSYFLWSSMPDDELFACAAKGSLQNPAMLKAQVRRMLNDPRAHALATNFAGQWLQLRNLETVAPDPEQFPAFNDELRHAMRQETEMFFEAIVREDRSVLDFLDAKFTYLNEPLARHYAIEGIKGDKLRRVVLTDAQAEQRGGILTQASILTVTSNPTRTSPVKRGKWVLEQILGTPPPPPPPGVPDLKDDKAAITGATLRQRLEQHRKDPNCASCHSRMDPIGFGLENYDATGAWRTADGNFPVDASGTLTGGQSFKGPAQLKAILKVKKTEFVRCLAEKMLTYALGRGLESYDKCVVDDITKSAAKNNYRFSALVTAVVQSEPFCKRRGDGGKS